MTNAAPLAERAKEEQITVTETLTRLQLNSTLAPMLLTSCREFQVEATLSPHTRLLSTSPSGGTADACASLTESVPAATDEEHLRTP